MKRREFLTTAAYGAGATWLASKMTGPALAMPELTRKISASDTVVLGNTAIRTSRLAMGTGTVTGGTFPSSGFLIGVRLPSALGRSAGAPRGRESTRPVRSVPSEPL